MSIDHPSSSASRAVNLSPRANLRHDIPAGLVVALVALPLCLGIALASGAPLAAGLVTGIVAGTVVACLTGSPLSVSGPAAGLTAIVVAAIGKLGYPAFLTAVCISGVLQLVAGLARGGLVAYYFPSSVVRGLLAAIGLILILKQIPHAIGFDMDPEGEMSFEQLDGRNTFSEIVYAVENIHVGATLIAIVGLAVLVLVGRFPALQKRWMPAPLAVVLLGIAMNLAFGAFAPELVNARELLVQLGDGRLLDTLPRPDFARIADPAVLETALTLAIVGSLETLLCIEAMDRLDPFKRSSDANKELRAQGIGNTIAGALGGIPMTAVIVRGSANVQAGARTPVAAFVHGVLLAAAVLVLPRAMEQIPLAALAAVLLHVGYKLAKPQEFVRMWRRGFDQFVPFIATVLAILFTDLLIGVLVGLAAGIFFVLRVNLATPYFMHSRDEHARSGRPYVHIELSENVSFLNKASVNAALHRLPSEAIVVIDGSLAAYIDHDVLELVHEFAQSAHHRGIDVHLVDIPPEGTTQKPRSRAPVLPGGERSSLSGLRSRAPATRDRLTDISVSSSDEIPSSST